MSLNMKCPGLIYWNNLYENASNAIDIAPLRVAVLNGCHLTLVDYFNIIMASMKRPFVLTYCSSYNIWNYSIIDELVNNRSDFSPNIGEVNFNWYRKVLYSPTFFFGNAITILSGKILADNGNGFSILSSFSLKIWLSLFAIFVFIAICNSILHKEYFKWTFYLLGVVGHFVKLWAVFINQSIQLGNICCVKHLIVNSVTIISIFVMTLLFTSEILSKLLFYPLVKIDTMDDLVKFVNLHQDVKLISDNITSSWFILKDWQPAESIFPKIISVPITKFDYKQVHNGKSIIISFDSTFENMLKLNRDLNFHMSADRLFGFQYGLLYSKHIDLKTKQFIDSKMSSLFENGIYKFMKEKKRSKRLDIVEDDPPQTISISYFKKVVIIYAYKVYYSSI